jgi:N-acetyl-anhydromuramyl-L-alanine amidase AmpD
VGRIKSRAKEEGVLTKEDQEFFKKIKWNPSKEYQYEKKKQYPIRYPHNYDSIGIETVGSYNTKTKKWEELTEAQKKSFAKLYNCLIKTLKLNKTQDAYTHEQISRKTKGEGQTVLEAVRGLI